MSEILNVLGSLGFNWHVALANFFNFLVIFFLLQKFLFKKVAKTLGERKKVIEDGVRKSEESEELLVDARARAKALVSDAQKEGSALISESEAKANALALSVKQQADTYAENVRKEAEDAKKDAYEAGLRELSSHKEVIMAKLFEKALGEMMTKELNDKIIANFKK